MSVVEPLASPARRSKRRLRLPGSLQSAFWWLASVGLFAGIWELCWYFGWLNPMLMPPPHMFLQDFLAQGRFFDRATRMGNPSAYRIASTVAAVVAASAMRVLVGLAVAFVASLAVGLLVRYTRWVARLVVPVVQLLAPVSPVAWLPVALLLFGVGDLPAIFMVFIALFFIMTLATVSLVDAVPARYLQVARNLGASRSQVFLRVILPAILPGLFLVLRLNLFAAWMVVLIAEAVGVGGGLGLVVMMAKNTFDARLAFFTMAVIGVVGFGLDVLLRQIQRRALYWMPAGGIPR